MPEHLRSLVVILLLAIPVFAFAKMTISFDSAIDFKRRCSLWFALTLIIFVSHNFWIYVILVVSLLPFAATRETNKIALFYFLLFAVPPISDTIPGLGLVKYFFALDHVRLLEIIILFPAYLRLMQRPDISRFGQTTSDKFVGAYFLWSIVILMSLTTFTNTLRNIFYIFIDIFLPYYVVSRALKNSQDLRDALSGFVVAAMVLAAVGIFELFKGWLLYSSLNNATEFSWGYGGYLLREGNLRAVASTGQPIVLGYVMVVALGFFFFVQKFISSRLAQGFWIVLLIGGLIAPQSRGPWTGAAVLLLVFIATGPQAGKRLVSLAIVGAFTLAILLASPLGEKMISYLPFVGTVEQNNITYRQQLIESSTKLVIENPIWGVPNALAAPELQSLRQGQGIIDIVNSYISIALGSGLVGLALFVSVFLSIGVGIVKALRRVSGEDDDLHLLGRVLISTLISILVMIATVSSISVIPLVYWSVAGLGLAYIQMVNRRMVVVRENVVPFPKDVSAVPTW